MVTVNDRRVYADNLSRFAAAARRQAGMPPVDAELVADSLVQADLWGHQSHGVMRLSWYLRRLEAGVMHPVGDSQWVSRSGAVAVLNGADSVGQVTAGKAMAAAIELAELHGIGAVAVRNSNHFGTAMYFTRMAPCRGQIGMLLTNASPAKAPWGGGRKSVGTNPWSIAAPAVRHDPLLLDISNTHVARGKIYLASQQGRQLPPGWAADSAGEPTTDPATPLAGMILPMAGHKGYAIAVLVDVLAGVLSGSGFASGVRGPYQAELRAGVGHLAIALDIQAFMPLAEFNGRAEELIRDLKSVPPASGVDAIYYPGEQEARSDRLLRGAGITLPATTAAELTELAASLALEPPTYF